ncbi:hypothetical protein PL81_34630, partial [Streptomyces sp. RSD-27]
MAPEPGAGRAAGSDDPAEAVVQEVLAGLPGSVVFLRPQYGAGGEVVDFRLVAASPGAVDIGGRRGPALLGLSVLRTYPGID